MIVGVVFDPGVRRKPKAFAAYLLSPSILNLSLLIINELKPMGVRAFLHSCSTLSRFGAPSWARSLRDLTGIHWLLRPSIQSLELLRSPCL